MEIFGYSITKKIQPGKLETFQVEPDSAVDVTDFGSSGIMSYNYDLVTVPQGEIELIKTYRRIALSPDIDLALGEIKNEVFVFDTPGRKAFEPSFPEETKLSEDLRIKIGDEIDVLYNTLDFNNCGLDLFMDFYIDGKMYFHKVIDKSKPKLGIQKIIPIDPLRIKKIREVPTPDRNGIFDVTKIKEYYIFQPNIDAANNTLHPASTTTGLMISPDAISYTDSGIRDKDSNIVVGFLYKSVIPYNNLKLMEDSSIVLRVSRSPERRVIYVDVGNLPKARAESYMKDLMNRFKTKMVYDSKTGSIADRKNVLSMVEDYWLPRREGGRGTEIETLPGCLAMDTKVELMDGRQLSINDITAELNDGKELWTYSCNQFTGKIKPGIISWAGVTQKSAAVMKITLSNGESITCTPDHKFPVFGFGFIRADELSLESKIISFHKNSAEQIYDWNYQEWITIHDHKPHHEELIAPDDITITAIELLAVPIEVGTLTIDECEAYHNYHTFALAVGVFTKNSDNIGVIADIEYFRNKLYQSLNVPASRFKDDPSTFSFGKSTEINRDEYRFKKFLNRARQRFMYLFEDLLKTQLILKKIICNEDWDEIRKDLQWNYTEDNAFVEYKESEILMNRVNTLQAIDQYIGKYFTEEWVFKNVLRYSEEEIKTLTDGRIDNGTADNENF